MERIHFTVISECKQCPKRICLKETLITYRTKFFYAALENNGGNWHKKEANFKGLYLAHKAFYLIFHKLVNANVFVDKSSILFTKQFFFYQYHGFSKVQEPQHCLSLMIEKI